MQTNRISTIMTRRGLVAAIGSMTVAGLLPAAAFGEAGNEILSRDAVLRDPDIPALGNPKGDLTVVEFFDYQCPYCKKLAPEIAQVIREDGNDANGKPILKAHRTPVKVGQRWDGKAAILEFGRAFHAQAT